MSAVPLDFTVAKIVSLLENEASLVGGIHAELSEIKNELVSMKAFLTDADKKGLKLEVEKAWVENVRVIAYNVEDIIEEFMYLLNGSKMRGKFTRFLHHTIFLPMNLWVRRQIAMKLQNVNNVIKTIPEKRQRYGIGVNPIMDTAHVDPKRLNNRELRRTVISVVGMGGSGKITLVAKAFSSPTVKQHFDCYAWISVSTGYVIEDLLKNLIEEFYQTKKELIPMDLNTMSYRQLVEILVNYLKGKRYIVVLDDVWTIHLWFEIKGALPDGRHGSRVLLTTRKEDIASFSFGVRGHVHRIPPLGRNEGWDLFCLKAFSGKLDNCCPSELEIIARDIVEKCAGLPLAIVALGGLMSTKKLESEWRRVSNSLNWELCNNPMLEVVKSILLLCFNDLPYRLKHCFLYCCIFLEGKLIRRKKIIRLWMAEEFVEEIKGLTPEEVGEGYLMELISRSMLEVTEKNPSGRPKTFKMHDLMRELALSISDTQNFFVSYDGRRSKEETWARRLSMQTIDDRIKAYPISLSCLRSLFVFLTDTVSSFSLQSMFSSFRLLRVLDMEYVPIQKLPDELGNLFNLRFLSLKGTRVENLPSSVGRLYNLQTLNLYLTKVKVLPSGIGKLQILRYLIACHYNLQLVDDFNYVTGMQAPSSVTKLKDLQVLHYAEASDDIVRHVHNLTQLTCLGMTKVRGVHEIELCRSIQKLNRLRHLSLMVRKQEEVLKLNALSKPPPLLRRLNLIGKLERVPSWFGSLDSLTALYISWSRLEEDPVPHILELPNLRRLTLVNAYAGKQLCFRSGFYKLKTLTLRNFRGLNEIIIERGAMPDIESLWISKCMELIILPRGIEHLTSLQNMNLVDVSENAIDRIRGEGSMDRPKVQHIPSINYYYQTLSGWYHESLA
ncbi:unnamed protein product [Ilex paraguariensis]|uniref:Uncharacterized protein n=1 Tax=Ilex paraguariensis TaxID=185542 RepID=A0ABC8THQ4_9AQUA